MIRLRSVTTSTAIASAGSIAPVRSASPTTAPSQPMPRERRAGRRASRCRRRPRASRRAAPLAAVASSARFGPASVPSRAVSVTISREAPSSTSRRAPARPRPRSRCAASRRAPGVRRAGRATTPIRPGCRSAHGGRNCRIARSPRCRAARRRRRSSSGVDVVRGAQPAAGLDRTTPAPRRGPPPRPPPISPSWTGRPGARSGQVDDVEAPAAGRDEASGERRPDRASASILRS